MKQIPLPNIFAASSFPGNSCTAQLNTSNLDLLFRAKMAGIYGVTEMPAGETMLLSAWLSYQKSGIQSMFLAAGN